MKQHILLSLLLTIALALALCGCSKAKEPAISSNLPAVSQPDSVEPADLDAEPTEITETEVDAGTQSTGSASVGRVFGLQLYHGDSNAEFLISDHIEVPADQMTDDTATGNLLVEKLKEIGVLNEDVALNSISFAAPEGGAPENMIVLDFNDALAQQLNSAGTAGERIVVGSIVNTFLSCYAQQDKQMVLLWVNGNGLETGHNTYDDPQTVYAPNDPTTITMELTVDGTTKELETSLCYNEMGFAINLDATDFEQVNTMQAVQYGGVSANDSTSSVIQPIGTAEQSSDPAAKLEITKIYNMTQEEYIQSLINDYGTADTKPEECTVGADGLAAQSLVLNQNGYEQTVYVFTAPDNQVWCLAQGVKTGDTQTQETIVPQLALMLTSFRLVS